MNPVTDEPAAVSPGAIDQPAHRNGSLSSSRIMALGGLLALLWAAILALIMRTTVGTDVGWYLVAARKWLAGGELYTDIVEVNPPLAFYLVVPATWLEDLSGFGSQTAFFTYVAILAALSLALCCRIVLAAGLKPVLAIILALALFDALLIVPFTDFGQREHFMLIFALPYLVMSALFAERNTLSTPERFAIGALAVIGLALKPYFLAMPVMVTVARMALGGSLRQAVRIVLSPENLAIGFGCIFYLLLIWIRHPVYLETVLPMVREIYIGVGHEYAFWMRLTAALLFLGTPPILFALTRSNNRPDGTMIVLLAAIAGFTVSHLVQGKGWHYHFLPALACIVIAASVYAGLSLTDRTRPLIPALALLTAIYLGVVNPLAKGAWGHPEMQLILAAHQDRLEGRKIASWTPRIEISFPLVNVTHAQWASRYAYLWPLSGALQTISASDDPQVKKDARTIIETVRGHIVDDLIALRPDIILISGAQAESYRVFLETDPRFDEAFAPFSKVDVIEGIEIWERASE